MPADPVKGMRTRDERRGQLQNKSRRALIRMCTEGVTAPGGRLVQITGPGGGPATWSREDLIAAILNAEFPLPAS